MDNLFCVDDLTPSFPQVEVKKAQTEEQTLGESLGSAKVTPLIKETKGRQGLRSAGVLHHINYNWRSTAVQHSASYYAASWHFPNLFFLSELSPAKVLENPHEEKWLQKNVASLSGPQSSTVPSALQPMTDSSQPSWMELAKRKSMAWSDKSMDWKKPNNRQLHCWSRWAALQKKFLKFLVCPKGADSVPLLCLHTGFYLIVKCYKWQRLYIEKFIIVHFYHNHCRIFLNSILCDSACHYCWPMLKNKIEDISASPCV